MSKIDLNKYTKVKSTIYTDGKITSVLYITKPENPKKHQNRDDEELSQKLAPLTLKNLEKLNEKTKTKTFFQFGCYDCQKFFWAV